MKKNKSLFPALLVMLIIFSSSQYAKGQLVGIWSGTLKMTQKSSGNLGTFERTTTVFFTNNIGMGTVGEQSVFMINGQKFCEGTCSGTDSAELHEVVIDKADHTYRIHAISPRYLCSFNGSNCEFAEVEKEKIDLIVSDKPLISDDILAGTETRTNDIGAGTTLTTTISWNLSRSKQADVELIVTPVGYDTWLPKPGMDEYTRGSEININLKLQGRNGAPLKQKAKEFVLQLTGTSAEPGLTINYPLQPLTPPLFDLRFLPQNNAQITDEFQVLKIQCNNPCVTGSATIVAYDGGAYASLTVYALLEDDSRVTGTLLLPGGITEIPIPKRNGSIIAEAWLNANGNPGDYDDNETSSGNPNNGDGLTAYEEYRGVMSEGNHKRLDPQKKELGISMPRSLFGSFSQGIEWFKNASDIEIVRFYVHEIAADRKLNRNFSTGHIYDQYVLYLISGVLPTTVVGKAYTTTDNPETPARTTRVVVDLNQFDEIYQMLIANERPSPVPYTEAELIASTIAHELAHGVNVSHHGDPPNEPSPVIVDNNTSPIHHIFDAHGNEIRYRPYAIEGVIGKSGNQESGDLSCFMAYNPYCSWAFHPDPSGTYIFRRVPPIAIGRKMCKSDDGTGINATNDYFGNASAGNCFLQVKLKD